MHSPRAMIPSAWRREKFRERAGDMVGEAAAPDVLQIDGYVGIDVLLIDKVARTAHYLDGRSQERDERRRGQRDHDIETYGR